MSSNHSLHLLSERSRHCSAGCSIDWLWRLALARTATNGKCHPSTCSCPPTLVIRDPSTSIPHLAGIPSWLFLYFRPRYNILVYVLIVRFVRIIKRMSFLHNILVYQKSGHLKYRLVRSPSCFTYANTKVRIYLYTYINYSPNAVSHSTVSITRLNKYMQKNLPKAEKYKYTRKNAGFLLMAP
jgi:hypothetical protein